MAGIEAYHASLECLIGFLEAERGMAREDIGFGTLDRTAVKAWVAWMNGGKGYSAKTVNLRLTALKSFLRYCSAEDPSLNAEYVGACAVRPPKVAKRAVDYLVSEETRSLLAAYSGRTAKERRNRAMLVLLYESGAVSLVLKNAGEAARATCPGMPRLH